MENLGGLCMYPNLEVINIDVFLNLYDVSTFQLWYLFIFHHAAMLGHLSHLLFSRHARKHEELGQVQSLTNARKYHYKDDCFLWMSQPCKLQVGRIDHSMHPLDISCNEPYPKPPKDNNTLGYNRLILVSKDSSFENLFIST